MATAKEIKDLCEMYIAQHEELNGDTTYYHTIKEIAPCLTDIPTVLFQFWMRARMWYKYLFSMQVQEEFEVCTLIKQCLQIEEYTLIESLVAWGDFTEERELHIKGLIKAARAEYEIK